MGLTDTNLIYASGVNPRDKIQAVAEGQRSSFLSTMVVGREQLEKGPDLFAVLFLDQMGRMQSSAYLNSDVVRWIKINGRDEVLQGLTEPLLQVLGNPPSDPELLGDELDKVVAPILDAMKRDSTAQAQKAAELNEQLAALRVGFDPLEQAWQLELDALRERNPEATLDRSPEHEALMMEMDQLSRAANDADVRSKNFTRQQASLLELVDVIRGHATMRSWIGRFSPFVGPITVGLQLWEESSMVLDAGLYPVEGDFVSVLLDAVAQGLADQ